MRPISFPRRDARRRSHRQPWRRTYRPLLEHLETRVVPQATLTSLSPDSVPEASPSFTLTVDGSDFDSTAVIEWNGTSLATTVVDSSHVTASVPASLLVEEANGFHGSISVTVLQDGVDSNALPFAITEAQIVPTGGFTIGGTSGQPVNNAIVATFVDPGGSENATDPGDYAATIDWGDGTATSTGSISGPDQNGVFTVTGGHTYAATGNFTVNVSLVHEGLSPVTVTDTANIGSTSPVVPIGGLSINGVEGMALNNITVATFTGGSNCSATIDWGDGTTSTGAIGGPDSNGVSTVTGSHTYAEEGNSFHTPNGTDNYVITVTINSPNLAPVSVTDSGLIAEAPIAATGGMTFAVAPGQALSGVAVATFSDTGGPQVATADYSATIDWGDGTTTAGTITDPDQNGVFTVSGDHTYAATQGEFIIGVRIVHESAAPVAVSDFANITPPSASGAGGLTINGVEGMPLNNVTVATFSTPAFWFNSSATIDWGDGTTSTGTVTGPDINGVTTVTGSHTYAEESNTFHTPNGTSTYVITVTVSTPVMPPVVVTDNAAIAEAPIVGSAGTTFNVLSGQPINNLTVATFTDAGGPQVAAQDYTATINWGDGNSTVGTITGPDQNGVFTVSGDHTYTATQGKFIISVSIVHESAVPITVADFAIVTTVRPTPPGPVMPAGATINGVEGMQLNNVIVATFTGGGNGSTATIDWGDGTTSTGTVSGPDINGVFTVTGTHTYVEESNDFHTGGPSYAVTVTITPPSEAAAMAMSSAVIAEAPINATGGFTFASLPGQPFTDITVATFTDSGGAEPASVSGEYAASIDWGDGTSTTGTITGPDQNGVFTVTGSHTYTVFIKFTITVTINHETAPPVSVMDIADETDPPSPPGGGASVPGHPFLVMISLQTGGEQSGTAVATPTASTAAEELPSQSFSTVQAAAHAPSTMDWQLLQMLRRNRIVDLGGWAANELISALYGMTF